GGGGGGRAGGGGVRGRGRGRAVRPPAVVSESDGHRHRAGRRGRREEELTNDRRQRRRSQQCPPSVGPPSPCGCSCPKGASSSVSRGPDGGARRDLPGGPFDGRREAIHSRQKLGESREPKSPGGVVGESPLVSGQLALRGETAAGLEPAEGGAWRSKDSSRTYFSWTVRSPMQSRR